MVIYKDPMSQFLIKVGDHPSKFENSLFVNYLGDRYMAKNGVLYVVTKNPAKVYVMGVIVHTSSHLEEESSPIPFDPSWRLMNFFHPIDDIV